MKMSLEQLKAEAAAHGYTIIKKQNYIKFEPCPECGGNRRETWFTINGFMYRCMKCGFSGGEGKTKREARKLWNEAVKATKQYETLDEINSEEPK